jgi:hypothetical protein
MYTYEDHIMKSTKHCLKRGRRVRGEWKYNGGGKHIQGRMHACMELLK